MGVKRRAEPVAVGVTIVAMLLATASKCGSTGGVTTKADNLTGSSSHAPQTSSKAARVGQPITITGNGDGAKVQVTVVKVVNSVTSTDGFSSPAAGMRWVAVQFKILNTGTATYDDAPTNGTKLIDKQGQQFDSDFTVSAINAGPVLPVTIKIAPGGTALGFIVFPVPTASKQAKVQFSQDSGFGGTAEWVIG